MANKEESLGSIRLPAGTPDEVMEDIAEQIRVMLARVIEQSTEAANRARLDGRNEGRQEAIRAAYDLLVKTGQIEAATSLRWQFRNVDLRRREGTA